MFSLFMTIYFYFISVHNHFIFVKVGDGVLLGAGTSVLGNVKIGEGCQVGAGGLVITDLPEHSVAVGVPVKIIGNFVDVTEQPSISMNQTFLSEGI